MKFDLRRLAESLSVILLSLFIATNAFAANGGNKSGNHGGGGDTGGGTQPTSAFSLTANMQVQRSFHTAT
jgi:hypothetical protein